MLLSSLVVIMLSAASAMSPFSHVFHLHPSVKSNNVTVWLQNRSAAFEDVSINGRSYTVSAHQWLHITGPAGTTVVADSRHGATHRGDTLLILQPELNNAKLPLK